MPDAPKKTPYIATNNTGRIIETDIVPEMEKSYLDYAMSVIVARALPDVRDGLKPVHRRIIYAMDKMGLTPGGRNYKSAAVVGEVLKSFHPHGDMAVYMSLVRMAQDFSLRYPLVKGQGNFGSIDGDPPAAMRYTEVRMTRLTMEMVADIDKETVDMVPNYDATLEEPSVLPARIPNLLLNGADGIAVGMATRIPPHNLKEICLAIDHILHHTTIEKHANTEFELKPIVTSQSTTQDIVLKDVYELEHQKYLLETTATVEQLVTFVQGPDFPTAGEIFGKTGIVEMYNTGHGKFDIRGKTSIETTKLGKMRIIITELPYQVNKAEFVKKIADLARDKKIIGISDLRDESDRHGIRVVVEIRKNGKPKSILNKLFKYTPLQSSYSANMLALVDGIPQTLNLRQMLLLFLRHREQIIRRLTIHDLKGAKMRAHILEGLKKALDVLDEVIKTIRASATAEIAKENLMTKFKFTDLQAAAILEMQLRRLAALERQKLEEEYHQLMDTISGFLALLTQPDKMIARLIAENNEIIEKYGDPRLTKIYVRGLEEIKEEDLVPNEEVLVTITKSGYIKRVPRDTYRTQARGGKGISGMTTKTEDEVETMLSVETHDDLLFFTNRGRVFKTKVWDLPESSRQAKGMAVINLINILQGETIQTVLPLNSLSKAKFIILATKKGTIKKTSLDKFKNIRLTGLAAIKLDTGDELSWAKVTSGKDQIFLVTHTGKCIRFSENDIRPMGRHTRGVRGIMLKDNDLVVSMDVIPEVLDSSSKKDFRHLLTVTENGIGKRSDVYQYPLQKRGGVGVKVSNLSEKTGKIAVAQVVNQNSDQILLVSRKAVTIKLPLKNIPTLNRNTRGVILMRLKTGEDKVTSLTVLEATNEPETKNN